MEFRNPVLSHIALEEHVRQGGAESGTGKMWEGLPSSDLRILTLAKNPANIVGGKLCREHETWYSYDIIRVLRMDSQFTCSIATCDIYQASWGGHISPDVAVNLAQGPGGNDLEVEVSWKLGARVNRVVSLAT